MKIFTLLQKIIPITIGILLLCGSGRTVQAQAPDVKFERITIEQGLSQSTIFCILQDSRGFMWFGTEDGLNKYDGYKFTVYRFDQNDPTSLGGNKVYAIHEDKDGQLWIGTVGGGLNRFNRNKEQFVRYQNDPKNPHSLSSNEVTSIYEDKEGFLWLGTWKGGLNKFDKNTGQFTRYLHDETDPNSLSFNDVFRLYVDRSSTLWVGTYGGGLDKFDKTTGKFSHYRYNENDPASLSNDMVQAIYEDSDNTLWIGTSGGLDKFDPATNGFSHYRHDDNDPTSLSYDDVYYLYEDTVGALWVGTFDGGLNHFDRPTGKFTHYGNDPNDPTSLSNNEVISIYEDKTGVLWIGTWIGLNKFERNGRKFTHYYHNPKNPHSLNGSEVQGIYEDNAGFLWIGTWEGGLNKFDPKSGLFTHYQHDENDPSSLSGNAVYTILEDHTETLWVGIYNGGLNKLNRETGEFAVYRHDENNPTSLSHDWVMSLYEDPDGALWVGTYGGGLNKFDRTTEQFTHYRNDPNNPASLGDDLVSLIYGNETDSFWVGTDSGLDRFDRKTAQFTHYRHDPNNPASLSSNIIHSIYIMAAKAEQPPILWVGTSRGLNKMVLDEVNNTTNFSHYTVKDGLPNNVIHGILEDQAGNLWLSTNKGLSKFQPQTGKFRNYDMRNGLQGNEFKTWASFESKSGEMFFGGINGFNAFYPEQVKDNPFVPPIALTNLQLFNEPVVIGSDNTSILRKTIGETKALVLSYQDYIVSFEFAALHYAASEKNRYAYKLEGFEKDWNYVDSTRRFATYTNLPAGSYVFHAKGSNNDGVWNETGTSIEITITPPIWQTWWAYTFYLLSTVALILGYVQYKTRNQAKELAQQRKELEQERLVTERLREVDRLKDEFLANTSHELRTPLNGIIGITESMLEGATGQLAPDQVYNLSLVSSSGRRLANLVNDILDFSKLKHQELQLDIRPIDIREVVNIVLTLCKPLVARKPLLLKNNISTDLPLVAADENRLQQIMHNLIGNAIKFTESGVIMVESEVSSPKLLTITVSDTGIGIPEDKLGVIFESFQQVDASMTRVYSGTGLGLSVTKRLVELHKGTIWVQSTLGQGSQFKFTLPISHETPDQRAEMEIAEKLTKVRADSQPMVTVSPNMLDENKNFKVLVVDDELVNVQVLHNYLSMHNFAVIQAFDGFEALEAVEETKPDIVLLDIMMPRMSGYEVCQKIRETHPPHKLPIILLTAKNQVSDLVVGFTAGANDYLTKPFAKNELLARVNTHLRLAKISTAYSRFVPREFLSFLNKESIIDVKLGDQIQKEMTVLFSDIRSFTTLSEQMTPQENFNFLNAYLRQVSPVIREHKGFIDKYIGDAIMALFPGQPDDAIQAAIAMQKRVTEYNIKRIKDGRQPIIIGIGLHSGTVMLGTVGESERMEGTVISDVVNLSARLEGLTKLYGADIVVSERTLFGLERPNQYKFRFLDKVIVKGKSDPVSVFEIFDGSTDDIITLKMETQTDFEKGLLHYYSEEFSEAKTCFDNVLAISPEDKAAQIYLRRVKHFVEYGVPIDWEGVEALTEK